MRKTAVVMAGLVLAGCQTAATKDASTNVAPEPVATASTEMKAVEVKVVEATPVAAAEESVEQPKVAEAAVATPVVTKEVAEPVVVAEAGSASATRSIQAAPKQPLGSAANAMDPRMDKVVKLIYSSSGARQVMESDSAKAHEYHERAKALYDQAAAATEKTEASRLLNEAVKSMYTAIRSASPEKVLAAKKKRDFDKLKRSVDTFLEQHERISAEKGAESEGQALRTQVLALETEAERLFDAGRTDDAQRLMRESFEMVRDSIEQMREGQTLVRSLNFATKKDEYDYELERYKSQRLLVDILLESKRKSSEYVAKKVDGYIEVAEGERAKAEAAASSGNHDEAVTFLEAARKQIVRALRTGGIFVPG